MESSVVGVAIKRRAPLFKDGGKRIVAPRRNLRLGGGGAGMVQALP